MIITSSEKNTAMWYNQQSYVIQSICRIFFEKELLCVKVNTSLPKCQVEQLAKMLISLNE